MAAVVVTRGVRRSDRGRAGGDRARRRLPGESRAAPRGVVRRRPCCARVHARAASAAAITAARRARVDDRLRVAGALSLAARRPAADDADQGHAPGRRGHRRREGCGRARDDRRPRAQRPLARVRGGDRPLARADGAAGAGRRDAPRLDGRRAAPGRHRSRRDPVRVVPGGLGHRGARRSPRSTRSPRSSRSAAAPRWERSARSPRTATSTWP